jgi:hypothetical protein
MPYPTLDQLKTIPEKECISIFTLEEPLSPETFNTAEEFGKYIIEQVKLNGIRYYYKEANEVKVWKLLPDVVTALKEEFYKYIAESKELDTEKLYEIFGEDYIYISLTTFGYMFVKEWHPIETINLE